MPAMWSTWLRGVTCPGQRVVGVCWPDEASIAAVPVQEGKWLRLGGTCPGRQCQAIGSSLVILVRLSRAAPGRARPPACQRSTCADSVIALGNGVDGLAAETITGGTVRLTRTECPSTAQLALLEEIRGAEQAMADDRRMT